MIRKSMQMIRKSTQFFRFLGIICDKVTERGINRPFWIQNKNHLIQTVEVALTYSGFTLIGGCELATYPFAFQPLTRLKEILSEKNNIAVIVAEKHILKFSA